MFILKYFKIMKILKVARQKENDGQILSKIGFLGFENSKDEIFFKKKLKLKLFEEFKNLKTI